MLEQHFYSIILCLVVHSFIYWFYENLFLVDEAIDIGLYFGRM